MRMIRVVLKDGSEVTNIGVCEDFWTATESLRRILMNHEEPEWAVVHGDQGEVMHATQQGAAA